MPTLSLFIRNLRKGRGKTVMADVRASRNVNGTVSFKVGTESWKRQTVALTTRYQSVSQSHNSSGLTLVSATVEAENARAATAAFLNL